MLIALSKPFFFFLRKVTVEHLRALYEPHPKRAYLEDVLRGLREKTLENQVQSKVMYNYFPYKGLGTFRIHSDAFGGDVIATDVSVISGRIRISSYSRE